MYRCFHMRAGMMLGLTLCWRLSAAAARAFHVTKSVGAGAGFAAGGRLPLRLLAMGPTYGGRPVESTSHATGHDCGGR
jgi:hypothetical protein